LKNSENYEKLATIHRPEKDPASAPPPTWPGARSFSFVVRRPMLKDRPGGAWAPYIGFYRIFYKILVKSI